MGAPGEEIRKGEPKRVENMTRAMLQILKLDTEALRKAYGQPVG